MKETDDKVGAKLTFAVVLDCYEDAFLLHTWEAPFT